MAAALHFERPDLIAVHFAPYALCAWDIISRFPVVLHFHGPWSAEAAAEGENRAIVLAQHAVETACYARVTRAIVLSQAFADLLTQTYGVPREDVRIVPGPVDVERFAREARQRKPAGCLDGPNTGPSFSPFAASSRVPVSISSSKP